jgi:ankyrin repeat protein
MTPGIDMDILPGKNGRTPLHQAYVNDQERCIKLLLENGADETIKGTYSLLYWTICLFANHLMKISLARPHAGVSGFGSATLLVLR